MSSHANEVASQRLAPNILRLITVTRGIKVYTDSDHIKNILYDQEYSWSGSSRVDLAVSGTYLKKYKN